MWHNNKKILSTFGSHHSQNAWANVESVGWRKIRPGATDGATNMFVMLSTAKAANRSVNVFEDNNELTIAYLT